jgi:hypothetical protein
MDELLVFSRNRTELLVQGKAGVCRLTLTACFMLPDIDNILYDLAPAFENAVEINLPFYAMDRLSP